MVLKRGLAKEDKGVLLSFSLFGGPEVPLFVHFYQILTTTYPNHIIQPMSATELYLQCTGVEYDSQRQVKVIENAEPAQITLKKNSYGGCEINCWLKDITDHCNMSNHLQNKSFGLTPYCKFSSMARMFNQPGAENPFQEEKIQSADMQITPEETQPKPHPEPVITQFEPVQKIEISFPIMPTEPESEVFSPTEELKLVRDKAVLPFANVKNFLPKDLVSKLSLGFQDQDNEENLPILLERKIEFEGIKGLIQVIPDYPGDEYDEDYYKEAYKPLGGVRWTKFSDDDEILIHEIPVTLRLNFNPTTMVQYEILENHELRIDFGSGYDVESYYLRCSGDGSEDIYDDTFEDEDEVQLWDDQLCNSNRDDAHVSLPMDLNKLSTIKIAVVK